MNRNDTVAQPRRRGHQAAQFAGQRRRCRPDLLTSTALQAATIIMLAFPAAAAGPAPAVRPQGGVVVAGQANISQTPAQTTVAQSSQRAAVDWTSFDIGSGHTVAFQQPNASSITLNRVTGPNPSEIAGRITANGQIAIVNGSGVVFEAGSQVDVQSLIVSSAGVTNRNFMAGKMAFDQPGRPGAKISNAGSISVAATGLAALVAPQVANSGVIVAKMGHVVLAGAEAHTIDLYGDGLMSIDVTRQVQHAPNGATALVTNTGSIVADGGTILLTAGAADGIIQNLVSTKGRLQANSVDGHTGTIVVSAVGGSISVEGAVVADGRALGASGGAIALAATDTVAIGAGARISASGQQAGGTVAAGTTLARARAQGGGVTAGSARLVTVADGASISADGHGIGSGGVVALLSSDGTSMAGRVSARGGRRGGNGGQVEISSKNGLQITGVVDTQAPAGRAGLLTIDPDTLNIGGTVTDNPALPLPDGSNQPPTGIQSISTAVFNAFASDVSLQAGVINLVGPTPLALVGHNLTLTGVTSINIGTALSVGAATLTLNGGTVTQTAGITAGTLAGTLGGSVTLASPGNAIGSIGPLTAGGDFVLNNGANPLAIGGPLNVGAHTVSLTASSVSQNAAGIVTAGLLTGTVTGATDLSTAPNAVGSIGAFTTGGDFALNDVGALQIVGTLNAAGHNVGLNAASLTQTAAGAITANSLTGTVGGATDLSGAVNAIGNLGTFIGGSDFTLNNGTSALNISGAVSLGTRTLLLQAGSLTQSATGTITAGVLTGSTGGVVDLSTAANAIGSVGSFNNLAGDFRLNNGANPLVIAGQLNAGGNTVSLQASALSQAVPGIVTAGTLTGTIAGVTDLSLATNAIANLGPFTNAGGAFTLNDGGTDLNISGPFNAAGQVVTLNAGSLTQSPAAIITAAVLTGAITGNATLLPDTVNQITSLSLASLNLDSIDVGTAPYVLSTSLDLGAKTLLIVAGSLTETNGATITAGTITGSTVTVTDLSSPNNKIAAIGQFNNSGGSFTLDNTGTALKITGPFFLGTQAVSLKAAALTQSGAGVIAAGTLNVNVAGVTDLTTATAGNQVASLGTVVSGGAFGIRNVTTLDIAGTLGAGANAVRLDASLLTQSPGAVISAGMLTGTVTNSATLTGASNAVANLGAFTTGAGFALDNRGLPLRVAGLVQGGSGVVRLQTGGLTLDGAAGARLAGSNVQLLFDALATTGTGLTTITAGGALELAPSTPNSISVGLGGGVQVSVAQIQVLLPITPTAVALQVGDATTATNVTLSTSLDLTGRATALALVGQGNVTQGPSTLKVGTILGSAGGNFTVDYAPPAPAGTPYYQIAYADQIGGVGLVSAGAGGRVSIASGTDLTVAGTVSAPGGTIALTSLGRLALNGAVQTGATGSVTLDAVGGITQTAAIATDALSGMAGDANLGITGGRDIVLTNAGNAFNTLGTFIAPQGVLQVTDAAPLAIDAAATVASHNTTVAAQALTVNGTVASTALGTAATGNTALTASASSITVSAGASVTGQTSAGLSGTGVAVAGIVSAPTVTIGTGLALTGGKVFGNAVTLTGLATMTGGLLHATTLNTPGGLTFGGGDLFAGNALAFTAQPSLTGQVATGGTLTVGGGDVTSSANVYARGTATIGLTGTFHQTSGVIASGGDLRVTAAGLAVQDAPGQLDAGGTLLLRGSAGGAAAVAGQLSGATIQVIEPNAALSFTPAGFAAADSHPLRGAATVVIGTLQPTTGAVTASSAAHGANRPANLRLDGGSLTLGSGSLVLAADVIELHSQLGMSQAGGSLETGSLSGTAGYAGSADPLPVYAPATAETLAGATVTLDRLANNIGQVTGYQVRGDDASRTGFVLLNTLAAQADSMGHSTTPGTLTLGGIVRAGPASDLLDATTAGTSGNDVAITTTGALALNGILAGRSVTLNAVGALGQGVGSVVVASQLSGMAQSVLLPGANQVASLGQFTASAGSFALSNSRNLSVSGPVKASSGNLTITAQDGTGTASVAEGQSAGTLTVLPPGDGGSVTLTARNVSLKGTDIVVNGLIGSCSIADATTGNTTLTAVSTVTVANLLGSPVAVIGGQTSVSVTAPNGVMVQSGIVNAPTVTIGTGLTIASGSVFGTTVSAGGPVVISGGLLQANTLNTPGGLTFNGGSIFSGNSISLTAGQVLNGGVQTGGALTITGGDISSGVNLVAGGSITISASGGFHQTAATIASGGAITITATGVIDQDAGAMLESAGALSLQGGGTGPASILGQLSAATVQIVQPNAAMVFAPSAPAGSDHALRGAATVTVTLANSFLCPGCIPTGAGTSIITVAATPGAYRPASLRLDGQSLVLGAPGTPLVLAADSIELHSQGSTFQAGGSLEASVLTGTAGYAGPIGPQLVYNLTSGINGATVTLGQPANNIAAVNGYQVRGDDASRAGLILVDAPAPQVSSVGGPLSPTGLALSGTIRSGSAVNALTASSEAASGNDVAVTTTGNLALNSVVAGVTVTLNAAGTLSEAPAGIVVAGRLAGSAQDVSMLGANQVATLGQFTATTGNLLFTDSRNLVVSGPVSAPAGRLVITTQNGAGTASAAEGQAAGTLTIVAPNTGTGASVAAQDVTLAAAGGVSVAGGAVTGPTITIGTGLNLTGGSVAGITVAVAGPVVMTGGLLHADMLSVPGGLTFGGGDLYSGNSVAVTAQASLTGQIATAGNLSVTGGAIASAANLYAAGDTAITTSAAFRQTDGMIASNGALTIVAGGLIDQDAPGTMAAGGTLLLRASGAGAAAVVGRLTGAAIDVIEPNAALAFAPSVFPSGSSNHSLGGSATVRVAGVAGTTSVVGSVTPGVSRPGTLRLDGATLTLGSPGLVIAADNVELHSLGATTQVAGSIETASLTGTAGYAGSAGTLPVYTPGDAQTRTATGYSAAPAAAAATVTLGSATNAITAVDSYQIRGDDASRAGFALNDSVAALTLAGLVRAGPATDPLDATAENAGGNGIAISNTGALSVTGTVAGSIVALNSLGALTESGNGAITASVFTGSAPSIALAGANQAGTLGPLTAATGDVVFVNSRNLLVAGQVSAASGTVALTARDGTGTTSVAEGQSAGALIVAASTGSATITGQAVALAANGVTVNGTVGGNTVSLAGNGSIAVDADAVIGGQASVTLTASGITQNGGLINAPAVTLNGAFQQNGGRIAGSTVVISGPLIQAAGSIWAGAGLSASAAQVGGTIASGGDISLTGVLSVTGTVLGDGSVSIAAPSLAPLTLSGTVVAQQDLTIVQGARGFVGSNGGITQAGGSLAAGRDVLIYAANGSATQAAGALAAGRSVTVVSLVGDNSFLPGGQPILSGRVGAPTVFLVPGRTSSSDPGMPGALAAAPGTGRPASVRLDGATLTLPRPMTVGTVELHSIGNTVVTGATNAQSLTGTAGYAISGYDANGLPTYVTLMPGPGTGSAVFSNAGNIVQRLGSYAARGGLAFTDAPGAPGLTIAGQLLTPSAPLSITLLGSQANLVIGDAASPNSLLSGGTVSLGVPGAVTEALGGVLAAGQLTGVAGAINLPGVNQVSTLSALTVAGGDLILGDIGSLTVTGPVSVPSGRITIQTAADFTVQSTLAAAGAVTAQASGAFTVGTSGGISGASLTSTSGAATTVTGSIATGGPVTIAANGVTITGGITSGGVLSLDAGLGALVQDGSLQTPATIATKSGQASEFGGRTVAGQEIDVTARTLASLNGFESAPLIGVTAPVVQLNSGTITVGGVPQPRGIMSNNLPLFTQSGGATVGAFFEAGSQFQQTGTTTIGTLAGNPNSTLRVDLTSGSGTITFQTLRASTTNLVLDIGAGSAKGGPIAIGNLAIVLQSVSQGSSDLNGLIGGDSGTAAAGRATVFPQASQNVRFNGCAASSVNCIILTPQTVPVGNPLKELSLNFFREQDDDGDLLIPNITEQGL